MVMMLLLACVVRSTMGFVCAEYDEEGDIVDSFACPDCTAEQKAEIENVRCNAEFTRFQWAYERSITEDEWKHRHCSEATKLNQMENDLCMPFIEEALDNVCGPGPMESKGAFIAGQKDLKSLKIELLKGRRLFYGEPFDDKYTSTDNEWYFRMFPSILSPMGEGFPTDQNGRLRAGYPMSCDFLQQVELGGGSDFEVNREVFYEECRGKFDLVGSGRLGWGGQIPINRFSPDCITYQQKQQFCFVESLICEDGFGEPVPCHLLFDYRETVSKTGVMPSDKAFHEVWDPIGADAQYENTNPINPMYQRTFLWREHEVAVDLNYCMCTAAEDMKCTLRFENRLQLPDYESTCGHRQPEIRMNVKGKNNPTKRPYVRREYYSENFKKVGEASPVLSFLGFEKDHKEGKFEVLDREATHMCDKWYAGSAKTMPRLFLTMSGILATLLPVFLYI